MLTPTCSNLYPERFTKNLLDNKIPLADCCDDALEIFQFKYHCLALPFNQPLGLQLLEVKFLQHRGTT